MSAFVLVKWEAERCILHESQNCFVWFILREIISKSKSTVNLNNDSSVCKIIQICSCN